MCFQTLKEKGGHLLISMRYAGKFTFGLPVVLKESTALLLIALSEL